MQPMVSDGIRATADFLPIAGVSRQVQPERFAMTPTAHGMPREIGPQRRGGSIGQAVCCVVPAAGSRSWHDPLASIALRLASIALRLGGRSASQEATTSRARNPAAGVERRIRVPRRLFAGMRGSPDMSSGESSERRAALPVAPGSSAKGWVCPQGRARSDPGEWRWRFGGKTTLPPGSPPKTGRRRTNTEDDDGR